MQVHRLGLPQQVVIKTVIASQSQLAATHQLPYIAGLGAHPGSWTLLDATNYESLTAAETVSARSLVHHGLGTADARCIL
jgi:hypothetical protein